MSRWILAVGGFFLCSISLLYVISNTSSTSLTWTEEEKLLIRSLSLPKNGVNQTSYSGNTMQAKLGYQLFFDKRLSINGDSACSSCHQPSKYFTDGKKVPNIGYGNGYRNTPTVVGAVYSPWQFWDGRADSLWSQALAPFEAKKELGNNRLNLVKTIYQHYAEEYATVYGPLPKINFNFLPLHASPISRSEAILRNWQAISEDDQKAINRVFSNIGKAIAAYESMLVPGRSRFDQFADALADNDTEKMGLALSPREQRGLKLFISEQGGRCTQCHNGPMLTNNDFQSVAMPPAPIAGGDHGREKGVEQLFVSEFNCIEQYKGVKEAANLCAETLFTKKSGSELLGAFKVPSLRNVSKTAPYMHSGQLKSLADVMRYYNRAPVMAHIHTDIEPLLLMPYQLKFIEAFLRSLDSQIATDEKWLHSPKINVSNRYAAMDVGY